MREVLVEIEAGQCVDGDRPRQHRLRGLPAAAQQDKEQEIAFFSEQAKAGEYQALTDKSNEELIRRCLALAGLAPGSLIGDLGCGSGVFTRLLKRHGLLAFGLDICHSLVTIGQRRIPHVPFLVGDVESLPIRSETLDGLLLGGLIHHLPDPTRLAQEAFRVLKPGGVFVAFDPNRHNPLMWLYRDRSSPFYSSKGVTPSENPIAARQVLKVFSAVGFFVSTGFCSVAYQHLASSRLRWALPLYNAVEALLFKPAFARPYRAFVLTYGVKPQSPFPEV